MFVIEDEIHAEQFGQFASFEEAFEKLKAISKIAWDVRPNVCPCQSWKTCGRQYAIIEYDESETPWKELSKLAILDISSSGVKWHNN